MNFAQLRSWWDWLVTVDDEYVLFVSWRQSGDLTGDYLYVSTCYGGKLRPMPVNEIADVIPRPRSKRGARSLM